MSCLAQFAMQYHQLATPLADVFFKEQEGKGVWTIAPLAHPAVDARLYQLLVELQFGHNVSLHRDVMGGAFTPSEVHVTFAKPISGEPNVESRRARRHHRRPSN